MAGMEAEGSLPVQQRSTDVLMSSRSGLSTAGALFSLQSGPFSPRSGPAGDPESSLPVQQLSTGKLVSNLSSTAGGLLSFRSGPFSPRTGSTGAGDPEGSLPVHQLSSGVLVSNKSGLSVPGGLFSYRSSQSNGALVTDSSVVCSRAFRRHVSFEQKDMLRGTRMAGVLRSFGLILAQSAGSDLTWNLSAPVKHIDFFLSHNWSTPRWEKFMVLALYFNSGKAFVAMLVVGLATLPFTALGFLPSVRSVEASVADMSSTPEQALVGVGAQLFGVPTLLLVLILAHEIGAMVRCRGPVVFLDKTCIHQTDPYLKQQGIANLAAYLANSQTMVIVYTGSYLRKLWTVYELASMLLLHPGRKIVVIPSFLPKLVVGGVLIYTGFMAAQLLTTVPGVWKLLGNAPWGGLVSVIILMLFLLCLSYGMLAGLLVVLTRWEKQRADIKGVLQSFSIKDAKCFVEDDRIAVERNIVTFAQELNLVPPQAEGEKEVPFEDRALDAFDDLVRREVPPALMASFGRQGVPYRHTLMIGANQCLRFMDMMPWWITNGDYLTLARVGVLYGTIWLAIIPLGIAAFSYVAARSVRRQHKNCAVRKLCVVIQFMMVCGFSASSWYALSMLSQMATKGGAGIVLYAACVAGHFLMVALVYRPMPNPKADRAGLHNVVFDDSIPEPEVKEVDEDCDSAYSWDGSVIEI